MRTRPFGHRRRRHASNAVLLAGLAAAVLIPSIAITAQSAANDVDPSYVYNETRPILIEELAPGPCKGMGLDNLILAFPGETFGTPGNDLILGTTSIDVIDGVRGNDCIVLGGGDDEGRGADGADVLILGPGDDRGTGSKGNDIIFGDDGADRLKGSQDDDILHGGDGDDTLDGGKGFDICNGNAGADTTKKCETDYP